MGERAYLKQWKSASCPVGMAQNPSQAASLSFTPDISSSNGVDACCWRAAAHEGESSDLARDVWHVHDIHGFGRHRLSFEGLATIADVFLDDAPLLQSRSMFRAHDCDIDLNGDHRLWIRFQPLLQNLPQRKGRARWRPRFIQPGDLRHIRTTALGSTPGFGPQGAPTGVWRPVHLTRVEPDLNAPPHVLNADIHARLERRDGRIDLALTLSHAPRGEIYAQCAGAQIVLQENSEGVWTGILRVEKPDLWFPHTHGAPRLHELRVHCDDQILLSRNIGFRALKIDRGDDGQGFALIVNDQKIFCRGAVWTPLDPISLQNDIAGLARQIELTRLAGFNMLRVAGPFVYEDQAFYESCDRAGVLVWQDFMFSNFDYPIGDQNFRNEVEIEASQFLRGAKAHPCLAVLCGGNEVYQQAAMLGLSEDIWRSPLFEEILPNLVRAQCPDIPYIANSPDGGALPFQSDQGVSHYYGLGAYRQPLEDARRANPRFASECLGFAHIPNNARLIADFGESPLEHPAWRAGVARDPGAAYDFQDVRDHYLALLYGFDPVKLRREDPKTYLDFSRALMAEIYEAAFAEWRRPRSVNYGALVWHWKDLSPGTGWGIIDWRGAPKSAWAGARRASQPLQILISEESVNGLHIHCLNETARVFEGRVELTCYRDGRTIVMSGARDIVLPPHQNLTIRDCELWGGFFDTAYIYRFGEPSHEATQAILRDKQGENISSAWHFPLGRARALFDAQIQVEAFYDTQGAGLALTSDKIAQSLHIECGAAIPLENWLHLAPNERRVIRFLDASPALSGAVAALGRPPIPFTC